MPKHIEIQQAEAEATVLVGLVVAGTRRSDVDDHLDELARLVDTAGGRVVDRLVQERPSPDAATLVGSGFVTRVANAAAEHDARSVIFDEDLTASQIRNLEREMPKTAKVLDRAAVILDIFAARARSSEAKTQVELAQLSYLLPRLTRRWSHLSRQAGGIGTRGVGETQLEIDRRLVSKRIAQLKTKLAVIERDRRLRRDRRRELPTVALVGYTNAGKSSLFRRMTRAKVLVEDRLFATLDPRARRVALGQDVTAVMTDTVGFIRKLPHDLVAPFRSTLSEAVDADLVLHVVDVSHPSWEDHLRVGDEVLEGLGVSRDAELIVLNKTDLVAGSLPLAPGGRQAVPVSAMTGDGSAGLRSVIRRRLLSGPGVSVLQIPLEDVAAVQRAAGLPHQLARRYRQSTVELALRADRWRLTEADLEGYLIDEWPDGGS
ncbi:MAG: GTPase HflX [Thermoanaerobaculales bacterium]|jgi:GTP-binding protein HflX|nr:GTPase HflX [Thermoanaerobaculales bacterium]